MLIRSRPSFFSHSHYEGTHGVRLSTVVVQKTASYIDIYSGVMEEKEKIRDLLRNIVALQNAMRDSVSSVTGEHANVARFSSFALFMRKYNQIADKIAPHLGDPEFLDYFDLRKIKDSREYTWTMQKKYFDEVVTNVAILRSLLENKVGFAEDETHNLVDFIRANLRRAIFTDPTREVEIQNGIESLLIGRGMEKGIDYDRETGRVKTSGKESVPDFIFANLRLCLEVKLSKSKDDLRSIVDQISADVRCYGTGYERQIYVVYDLSSIRDEAEFKKDIESTPGVAVVIVKH